MLEPSIQTTPKDLSLSQPTYLPRLGLYQAVTRHAPELRGAVLDYGCGKRPYERLLINSSSYIAADLPSNPNADIHFEPGGRVPLEDDRFDTIISTGVLQSVRDPQQYLAECRRMLHAGGRLLLSTHGFWCYLGDGWDWRRWTHKGLIYELETA